ncbi:MAG: hypothetical protein RM368_18010 [Nostoc sp. DedSLP03]|uniref:hypothetical protein n=1 Tax=Nostoc sp. DedSLP03 TaxID=3075400 RepID=UPI002AD4D33E|nr:hypothetical protein [Nostoc sp. DedSLP03]MDZ7966845.1 hypothetical protein [Nostoc sp. DedSLP03]
MAKTRVEQAIETDEAIAMTWINQQLAPTFNRNLRALAKKYRSIQNDIQPVIEQLQQGELPGDQIPGVGYLLIQQYLF